ncbi:MAG: hypothetical protein ACLPVP_04750, partial [Methanoregula sp.]
TGMAKRSLQNWKKTSLCCVQYSEGSNKNFYQEKYSGFREYFIFPVLNISCRAVFVPVPDNQPILFCSTSANRSTEKTKGSYAKTRGLSL